MLQNWLLLLRNQLADYYCDMKIWKVQDNRFVVRSFHLLQTSVYVQYEWSSFVSVMGRTGKQIHFCQHGPVRVQALCWINTNFPLTNFKIGRLKFDHVSCYFQLSMGSQLKKYLYYLDINMRQELNTALDGQQEQENNKLRASRGQAVLSRVVTCFDCQALIFGAGLLLLRRIVHTCTVYLIVHCHSFNCNLYYYILYNAQSRRERWRVFRPVFLFCSIIYISIMNLLFACFCCS